MVYTINITVSHFSEKFDNIEQMSKVRKYLENKD